MFRLAADSVVGWDVGVSKNNRKKEAKGLEKCFC